MQLGVFLALLGAPLAVLAGEEATYEPSDSKVNVLDYDNFHRFLETHHDDLILMEFYAPWCGHCQQLAPNYRKAAAELASLELPRKVVLAKFDDGDEYNRRLRAGAPDVYNFTSYPSLFVLDEGEHERYGGGREADEIVFHMTALAKGLDPYEEELKTKPGLYKVNPEYDKFVRDLRDEEEMSPIIADSPNNVIRVVEFYSDRCPFCKSLAKEYVEACETLKGKFGSEVECHAVNSRVYHDIAEEWGITGYPWVAFFYQGKKVEDMAGLGGADSIVNWVSNMHAQHFDPNAAPSPPPPAAASAKADAAPSEWSAHVASHAMPLLHSVARFFPPEPQDSDTEAFASLVASLAELYPSPSGRSSFIAALASDNVGPIDFSSPEALVSWVSSLESSLTGSPGTFDSHFSSSCSSCWSSDSSPSSLPFSRSVYSSSPAFHFAAVKSAEDPFVAEELLKVSTLAGQLGISTEKSVRKMRDNIAKGKKDMKHYLDYLSGEVEEYLKPL